MKLNPFSFGTGDRFGQQGDAQLAAVRQAAERGVDIAIVWNKSHREHQIIGTTPADVRREADEAVRRARWGGGYHVDADHIGLATVDGYIDACDFFTIDVADYIGERAAEPDLEAFVAAHRGLAGPFPVETAAAPGIISTDQIRAVAETYLLAMQKAAEIYARIERKKGKGLFITEISMDETDTPQTPEELLFILAAAADLKIPVQTVAPKFTGRFNKGVDYVGDVDRFAREFSDDVAVLRYAAQRFGLPGDLKLSVHSGSDKFSIYPAIRDAAARFGAGVHVKTAGTSWLEELIGLAESGPAPLGLVKTIYAAAYDRFDELCGPYGAVIDIDRDALPAPARFREWDGRMVAGAIRHDPGGADFDPNIRQLLHVGYKIAVELGDSYLQAVRDHREVIGRHVRDNLFARHIEPLFL